MFVDHLLLVDQVGRLHHEVHQLVRVAAPGVESLKGILTWRNIKLELKGLPEQYRMLIKSNQITKDSVESDVLSFYDSFFQENVFQICLIQPTSLLADPYVYN